MSGIESYISVGITIR